MRTRRSRVGLAALAIVLIAVLTAFALPATARADGFSMPQVRIDAVVQQDGSLLVTERRSFDFDDSINGVFWEIPLSSNQQGLETGVQIQEVMEESQGNKTSFKQVASASNGEAGVYTVANDGSSMELKVYSPHDSGDESTFTVTYVHTGAVMAWQDTAELYWKFIGDGWAETSDDVQMTVTFPGAAASGVPAKTGSDDANFRAWGHGTLNGEVSLDAAAPLVTFTAPWVDAGDFAEARVTFPVAWVPGLQAPSGVRLGNRTDDSGNRLPVVLSEEKQWADEANAKRAEMKRMQGIQAIVGIALPAVFFVIVLIAKLASGPKPKPTFTDTYLRDVPSDDHPAVIALFMEGRGSDKRGLVATLMRLTDEKVVAVTQRSNEQRGLFGGTKVKKDYWLKVAADYETQLDDPIDRAAVKVYFPEGETEVAFSRIKEGAKEHAEELKGRWSNFNDEVRARYEVRNLVQSGGCLASVGGGFLGAACGISSLVLGVLSEHWQVFAIGIPFSIAGFVLCQTFSRLTPEGAELKARCKALKKWLEDFTRLGEAVPGDVVLWNKLLVLAVALGVSEKILADLAAATPESYSDGYADGYYPIWWWCTSHDGDSSPLSSIDSFSNFAISDISSSSDGFGGGFSVGGGGGSGGGGGGTF